MWFGTISARHPIDNAVGKVLLLNFEQVTIVRLAVILSVDSFYNRNVESAKGLQTK